MSSKARIAVLCLLVACLGAALAAPAGAQAAFGIKSFSAALIEEGGSLDTRAGSHPYEYNLTFTMNQDAEERPEGALRDLFVELPAGMVGDPQALPRCGRFEFDFNFSSTCPGNSQVGWAELEFNRGAIFVSGVYNLTPNPGSPITLGLSLDNNNALLDASLRVGTDYGATVGAAAVPNRVEIQSVTTHIWGLPMAASHDADRFCIPEDPELAVIVGCSSDAAPAPFLTLPTSCPHTQMKTTMRVGSVQGESASAVVAAPPLEGCESLPFSPHISVRPETAAADSPTGLSVGIEVPQSEVFAQPATAHLKDATVTLPAGLAVNPSAATGRVACSSAQIDLKGAGPANCPAASKLGAVTAESPLVDHPLPGAVYLAAQGDNPFGSLIALYVTVDDPATGVVVKLAGKVTPDPETGQLSATFEENPQLPVEDIRLNFSGGPRAALTTPPTCGAYTTRADLTPWSAPEGKVAHLADSFPITEAPGGGPCPQSEAQMPNAPGFEAGTTNPLAARYSPFVMKLSREDGSQRLGALNVTLPPGLTGKLAGTAECPGAQIALAAARSKAGEGALEQASPSCPAASEIGTVTVGAGSGTPVYVTGHAYLAGPYKGAPLSIAIVTPAVAGPFDLGTVVVRSALYVDEETAQITVRSDPIPTILDGIPLDVRSIAVQISKSQFTLNPTSCEAKAVGGELVSTTGQVARLQNRFQVGGCNGLEFEPQLKIQLHGATKRVGHPALKAVLTAKPGEANIARAQVNLPHGEFLDQGSLDKTCTRPVLLAGNCPASSVYGKVKAWTPLLEKPLQGDVYLVGGYGYKLPALVAELDGQIKILLVGKVDSGKNKGIRNTFEVVPDAPVSRFVLEMKGGKKYGLLENSENLCKASKADRQAIVRFTGQNGKVEQSKPVVSNDCRKSKGKGQNRHG